MGIYFSEDYLNRYSMGRRNKITQVRNEIAKAIENMACRACHNNSCDEELLERFGVLIQVEYDVIDDFYRRVEISDIEVSGEKGSYPNIAEMICEILGKKLNEMNEENEVDFLDSLSLSEKRVVFEWI